jgi:hypothetical protein
MVRVVMMVMMMIVVMMVMMGHRRLVIDRSRPSGSASGRFLRDGVAGEAE